MDASTTLPGKFGFSTAVLLALWLAARVVTGQTAPPPGFSNPPLLYKGPDPTSNYFLPAYSAAHSSATVTPLPPPEFNATSSATDPPTTRTDSPTPLTPSSVLRNDPLTTLPQPHGATAGAADLPAASALNGNFAAPRNGGELIFPAESLDQPGAQFWPHGQFLPDGQLLYDPAARHDGGLTEHKNGFFQSFSVSGLWIDRNDKPDDFGLTEVDVDAQFALPLPTRDWPLLLTPAFNTRFLEGPQVIGLPPRIYETYLDLTWVPRLSARWTAIVGVAPSIYSDFEADGFRVTGKGLARYDWRPGQVQVIFGVLYLGRDDITILPAGGIIWTPHDRLKYELIFPRPKLAHLIRREARYEDWLYLGAEFGGNSYVIELLPGVEETITLRDYRAYIGLERKLNGGAGFRLEIGYVAGRVVEFASGLPEVEADDTAMIRGGITF